MAGNQQRPNRSDTHLSTEEEARIEGETRGYFEELAPKRHTKPLRSDFSSSYSDANNSIHDIPEYTEFQRLENDDHNQQKLVYTGGQVPEEFVETNYYKNLDCIDKQHHTTGTGFIAVENMNCSSGYNLGADELSAHTHHPHSHGNPATNEWIPAEAVEVPFASDKPKRSDN